MNQLRTLISNSLDIENILISDIKSKPIDADLILYTIGYLEIRARRYVDESIPKMVAKRVINHKNIREIISIEEDTDVLLINNSYESTMEAIQQLIELGLDHIRYNPYYPGCGSYPNLEIVITPGEGQLAPYNPKKLIDIESRILDIETIHSLARNLGLEQYLKGSMVTEYIRDIVEISRSIEESRRSSFESQQILQQIVNNLEYGVAFIDNEGKIASINSKFEYIFGHKKKDLLGKKLDSLVADNQIQLKDNSTFFTMIENKEVLMEIREVSFSKNFGYILMLKYDNSPSKPELKPENMKNRYIKRNLLNFDDYLTINKDVKNIISRAKKFAKSDGTVLITGENGTGKEILAQAIHANSYRNKNAFVPINITTLTSNLVESELFGYEEGTFTGAIKGGKQGIFEIANGGTIFIDEIGDVPLSVQTKLLRVLEEKRIRRVGGVDELSIDVRVIAATNKNLLRLVEKNKFKLDLFFRLNILPLEAIPLRNRKEDIEYLLKHFININLANKKMDLLDEFFKNETIDFLNQYSWPGNVRELLNLVEYLVLIYEGEKIGISSLHSYMYEGVKEEQIILDEGKLWVLKQFEKNNDLPLGRARLTEFAKDEGSEIGEGKIRSILKDLNNMELIKSYGSIGSKITDIGKKALEKYK